MVTQATIGKDFLWIWPRGVGFLVNCQHVGSSHILQSMATRKENVCTISGIVFSVAAQICKAYIKGAVSLDFRPPMSSYGPFLVFAKIFHL